MKICLKKKNTVFSSYSIVCPCYNVRPYMDDFIESIIWQSIGFKENVELILVDDGSTDGTGEYIDYWAKKYSKQIKAIHQKNAGVAAARNRGLVVAQKEWVTFTDPDDFLDFFALERVDKFLACHAKSDICMIALNIKFFLEATQKTETRPNISYKFHKKENILTVAYSDKNIQTHAASTLFRRSFVEESNLRFPENCNPTFEDTFFVNNYLLHHLKHSVAFLRDAVYNYRKRTNRDSLTDTAWENKGRYSSVFEHGLLPLIENAYRFNNGRIPKFIQNLIIACCGWHVRRAINCDDAFSVLNHEELENYLSLLSHSFQCCDPRLVWNFKRIPIPSPYLATGILGCFMGKEPPSPVIFFIHYDVKTDSALFRHYSCFDYDVSFSINSTSVYPSLKKTTRDTFGPRTFVEHHYFWIPLKGFPDNAKLRVSVRDSNAKSMSRLYSLQDLRTRIPQKIINEKAPHAHCWLISDQDMQANDNGEHLYRWIQHNHPEIPIRFLLNKNSHDWNRLKAEGFHLINYGSREHRKALDQCDFIISSHADDYIINYFREPSDVVRKHSFVFLQHGALITDESNWLNRKDIRLIITSSHEEYASIAYDGNRYRFTSREVKCTGLPRHDELLRKNNPQKVILVMPTCIQSLAGAVTGRSNARNDNPDFMNSTYAKTYLSLLNSEEFRDIAKRFGYRIIFFLDANIQQYLKLFELPAHIEIASPKTTGIQDLLGSGGLLVTDYSPVATEFAYLHKPVIYYQFDYKEMFENHKRLCAKGYFDWRRDGFGEVVSTQEELLRVLEQTLQIGCQIMEPYAQRAKDFFAYRDGRCCERVFSEILKLR